MISFIACFSHDESLYSEERRGGGFLSLLIEISSISSSDFCLRVFISSVPRRLGIAIRLSKFFCDFNALLGSWSGV